MCAASTQRVSCAKSRVYIAIAGSASEIVRILHAALGRIVTFATNTIPLVPAAAEAGIVLMAMETLYAIWRRLDVPGHDACRFERHASGWLIEGTAIFLHGGVAARLAYRVSCDATWRTQQGRVQGFIGARPVAANVERSSAGEWRLDGRAVPALAGCVHLDYGFTPATNFQQLRQLGLQLGEGAEITVAWLDVPDPQPLAMRALPQRYARRGATTYWYESPDDGYAALLELTEQGTIARYPGLWERETGVMEDG